MSVAKRNNIDFGEIFSKPSSAQTNIKIPGINMSDSDSSSDSGSEHGGFLKNKKIIKTRENIEEYVPTCSSPDIMKNLMESYVPKTIGGGDSDGGHHVSRPIYHPRTPSPSPFPENISSILSQLTEKKTTDTLSTNETTSPLKNKSSSSRKKSSKVTKEQQTPQITAASAIDVMKQKETNLKCSLSNNQKRKLKKPDTVEKDEVGVVSAVAFKAKKQKIDSVQQPQPPLLMSTQQPRNNKQPVKMAPAPPPSSSNAIVQTTMIKISDEAIWLVKLPKKSVFDVDLHMPVKYCKNILPIFTKGVRVDLFVQKDKQETMWANVSIKNADNTKLPLPLYKIVNVDENIINNLPISMNNNVKFVESVLNGDSDKAYKIYEESGIIRIGSASSNSGDGLAAVTSKDLYANARIELKKNITYVFNLSLNIVFAKNYINVHSEYFRCSLHSRNDNNYLTCLVLNVIENFTIENDTKLMHNI